MNPIVLILLGLLLLGWFVWLRSKSPADQRKANFMLIAAVLAAALFYLTFSGKLHWLGAVFAILLPFARRIIPLIPIFGKLFQHYQNNQNTAGNTSEVKSRMIKMQLDHATGTLEGEVLEGPFQGRQLSTLTEAEFIELLNDCRSTDAQSARLLETYLDKRFGDSWRDDDHSSTEASDTDKAYQILGLEPGASKDEVIEAHRRLMQKLHPDRGGSDYLAAEINQAKDQLLKLFT
ncbi:DnaJ domain-containing protein [Amphritea sp. 1_MG-2023]|uniref:DnaJ domain-containing protein n=1 Tax=Amphritea sp. 1_MG-2023 TaxID=3062670 RepID=UPI0026E3A981|nr:DnaJ domain-containing protein [Amphritea sp. 1_MG-2023]MDO6562201.1 DnaJ domain-containing protein [Amphritea sp. 1_MG-2023]